MIEVKCAKCERYFPLSLVKREGSGYYCKDCDKKRTPGIPITTNMEVRCSVCDHVIPPEDARVKDEGKVFCLKCYTKHIIGTARAKPGKETTCAICGRVLTPYDDKIQDEGILYCKSCFENVGRRHVQEKLKGTGFIPYYGVTSLRSNIIECAGCGGFFDIETLKGEKDGSVKCPKCGKGLPLRIRGPKAKEPAKKAQKEDFAETAQLFKCLGDPCRVKIIELLSERELCVFEFVDMLGFQYSAVSYHLKMLKELGIVQAYERGNFMVYSLTDKGETVHEFIERSRGLS